MGSTSFATHGVALAVLAVASVTVGYYLGTQATPTTQINVSADEQFEEDVDEPSDGDLGLIKAGTLEPCKLVLIVRTDLKMAPGKTSAQCGHATLACYKTLVKRNPKLVQHWERTGQAKIALKATSEKQLLELESLAKSLNLCARSVHDGGLTQVELGTRTVLAVGPAPVELVNRVTGKLRLL
ncbi:peptidyl-tRNA hydrolase PTH2-domain-containing protein [Mycena maculata]|uniref:peptidyl-tRNA hydrolase n=1 Tax=Mycena maculata TaxID=230809 RepID=A0AAD7P0M7_9AGAR|nr:peptidyl-tRNA hydrolase PTH2-domain-containing protein [Mycena maculata]